VHADDVLDQSTHARFVVEDDARHAGDAHSEAADGQGREAFAHAANAGNAAVDGERRRHEDDAVHRVRVDEVVDAVARRPDRIGLIERVARDDEQVQVEVFEGALEGGAKLAFEAPREMIELVDEDRDGPPPNAVRRQEDFLGQFHGHRAQLDR
jgi:hypothetical protein